MKRRPGPLAMLLLAIAVALGPMARAGTKPLAVSADGHHFVDGKGVPFFWLGTTQWALFRSFTLDEARRILDNAKAKGFTVVATMIVGGPDARVANVEGELPWIDDDPSRPNPKYFERVDTIVKHAAKRGLMIRIGLLHNSQLKYMAGGKGAAYAKWLAMRYKDAPNLIWSLHGNVDSPEILAMTREMVGAIQAADSGMHLISQKPDPSPKSSGIIQGEPWLAYTQSQTWKRIDLIYPMVREDYRRVPPKPTVMDEGAYEAGTEYGFPVTPLLVRRQAYYSYLAGGFHTYGHNDLWRGLPTWRAAIDAPGAGHLTVLKRLLTALPEWWKLVPDPSLLVEGGKTNGDALVLAARHDGGRWMLVYAAQPAAFTVDLSRLAKGRARADFVDPRSGKAVPAGVVDGRGTQAFTVSPEWEDAVLRIVVR